MINVRDRAKRFFWGITCIVIGKISTKKLNHPNDHKNINLPYLGNGDIYIAKHDNNLVAIFTNLKIFPKKSKFPKTILNLCLSLKR